MRSIYSTLSVASLPAYILITTTPNFPIPWSLSPSNSITNQNKPPLNSSVRFRQPLRQLCGARRRGSHFDDEDEDDDAYGHNSEFAMLESYSEMARSEALLVRASVDGDNETVLIFKGFSSCLSGRTPTNPARSILPARAVIESIDVIKGPFDPTNIEYLEKGLTWDAFKTKLKAQIQQ